MILPHFSSVGKLAGKCLLRHDKCPRQISAQLLTQQMGPRALRIRIVYISKPSILCCVWKLDFGCALYFSLLLFFWFV
ncbi:hypothetical protein EUGRSUZ_H00224 [Eucalyptus grandis]|uniref:Uncharacterized protein n=2 Tax=Eucalyptus grandis TaxID=71139 RepID=A0A059AUY0_EUCGR|nr:hypothetical protein EUGRSUZ_H00224 [Eucalyptus grandis]